MRSIFAKILLWSLGTLVLSMVAYWAIAEALDRRGHHVGDPFRSMIMFVEDEVCRAYEEGGPVGLDAHLKRLDAKVPGQHLLIDEKGRDLATGADRSDLFKEGHGKPGFNYRPDGQIMIVGKPRGGKYRVITIVPPWFESPNILPYYGAVVLVILGMGGVLAVHLASPLRKLRTVVDRFGQGDLSARVGSKRKDEIGELSSAFDQMAVRIETLLTAERRLLQDVSHELRSPLARLDVAVDLAVTSEDRGVSLGRIKRDVVRLSVLVDELLQLTRAEGDPSAREHEEIDLDDLLRNLVDQCGVEAEAKGSRLVLNAEEPCAVLGERELLHRAVENVVRNAIRHAPEGTSVEMRLEQRGNLAVVVVRDHGPGVPDAFLQPIFEPFFRAEGHRSRASGGVGLGLAIARRAVSLHQGKISAQNARPGPGLIVEIELPKTA